MIAYFIGITVGVSQLSMVVIWYYDIFCRYCENSPLSNLEKIYSGIFPVIFIRWEVWRLNNAIDQLEKKTKTLFTKMATDPLDHMISLQYAKVDLKMKKLKQKALDAERICGKMLNLRLVLCNFPQSIVNVALLVLAIDNQRMKKYLVNISEAFVNKSQTFLFFNQYFQYIVAALIIKTTMGLVLVIIKNRLANIHFFEISLLLWNLPT